MEKNLNDCTPDRKGNYREFTCTENRCTYTGKNEKQQEIRQFKIDGGIIPLNCDVERCDYILLNDTEPKAFFIELKGSDIHKAIDQIESSIRIFGNSISDYKRYRRIVYRTGSHDIQSSKVIQWKAKYPGLVKICSRKLVENL